MAVSVQYPCLSPTLKENPCLLSSNCQVLLSSASWKAKLSSSERSAYSLQAGVPRAGVHAAAARQSGKADHESWAGVAEDEVNSSCFDRRQLLVGSTSVGVAGLPSLWLPKEAASSPVQPPNFRQCTTPIDPGNGAPTVDCCQPPSESITDFKLPTNLPLRIRIPAQKATPAYLAKYKRAYELLRQLPSSDPRTYTLQANVHCAFCDGAYDVKGTQLEYQVHNSWFFFPWHRWYLYFHERILATLINDDTFALPFWNWDAASGATIPRLFIDPSSSLYDPNRNPAHAPPTLVDLNYSLTDESNLTAPQQLAANNVLMYRQVVTSAKTPSLFFGQAYRQGDDPSPGGGTVESTPHGTVHVWTGNPANPNDENMGTLYSAARDPIFFAHHCNVDRLWEVWKSLGGRRRDITDPDYLNATFLFYDENAKLVRVKIGDALDTTKLAYKFEDVPNPWLNARPVRSRSTATAMNFAPGAAAGLAPAMAGETREKIKEKLKKFKAELKEFKDSAVKEVVKPVRALVKRPKKVRADDNEEEILVLEGVKIATDEKVKFDVYINLLDGDDEGKVGCDVSEYAGSFVNVPHMGMKMGDAKRVRKSKFRLGIGDVLKELDIEDDDDFAITIVPRCKSSLPISVENVKLEYE